MTNFSYYICHSESNSAWHGTAMKGRIFVWMRIEVCHWEFDLRNDIVCDVLVRVCALLLTLLLPLLHEHTVKQPRGFSVDCSKMFAKQITILSEVHFKQKTERRNERWRVDQAAAVATDRGREIKRVTALCRVCKFCEVLFFKVSSVGDLKFGFFFIQIWNWHIWQASVSVRRVCGMWSTKLVTVQFSEFSDGAQ